jgi:hypothetical protein
MSTTVRSGAIYGIGTYGAVRYGVSSVAYTLDGVQATVTSDSGVIITGDANHVVVSLVSPAVVGSVGVVGVAVTSVVGVQATAYVGDNVTFSLGCTTNITGLSTTSSIGSVVVTAGADVAMRLAGWPDESWTSISFEPVTREAPFTYWYNAYVGPSSMPNGGLGYLPTNQSSSVTTGADYIGSIPPSPDIGEHIYFHKRSSVGGPVIATYDLGVVVGFPYDYSYMSRYSSVTTTTPSVYLPPNSGGSYPVAIGTVNNKSVGVVVVPDNTIYQNAVDASAWSDWVNTTISIGDPLYLTAGGVRRYYGVVTAKPLITGMSSSPQYGITVSNPDAYVSVLDTAALFETTDSGYALGEVGEISIVGDSNTDTIGSDATFSVGQVDVRSINRIPVDGVAVTLSIGNVTTIAAANIALVTSAISVTLGDVVVKAGATIEIGSVYTSSYIGDVVVANNARPTFDGVTATAYVGNVAITTVVFNYNAIAHLYDRRRVAYVDRRSSSSDRTIAVAAHNRTVYVDKVSAPSTRSVYVSMVDRKMYTYRKPSSSDRSVMVA